MEPGIRLVRRGSRRTIASVAKERPAARQDTVPTARLRTVMRGRKAAGRSTVVSPKKSLICVEAIRSAMPFVNPIVTGRGMNLTAAPRPVSPMITSIIPAIRVTRASPGMPNFVTIPATMTTNAPVGPPICRREPPSREIRPPATTAVYRPACGGTPDAIANAIANGSATRPTVRPASISAPRSAREYERRQRTDSGSHWVLTFIDAPSQPCLAL